MPPLNQAQLTETLQDLFGWADFPCPNMPRLSSRYCYEPVPGLTFDQESLAKQSFKEESDINNIVNRYHKTGEMPSGNRQPLYGDFSSGDDFQSALIKIQEAEEDFDNLPSHIRERFNNNPAELLDFVQDESNMEEAETLGLIPSKAPAEGSPAEPGQGELPKEQNPPKMEE